MLKVVHEESRPSRRTGSVSPRSRGPTCSATASAAGCGLRCSRSATVHSGSNRRCARCSPPPESSGTGSTSRATCSPRCPSPRTRAPGRHSRRSTIAEDREHALKAAKAFEELYGAKWPKAVAKTTSIWVLRSWVLSRSSVRAQACWSARGPPRRPCRPARGPRPRPRPWSWFGSSSGWPPLLRASTDENGGLRRGLSHPRSIAEQLATRTPGGQETPVARGQDKDPIRHRDPAR